MNATQIDPSILAVTARTRAIAALVRECDDRYQQLLDAEWTAGPDPRAVKRAQDRLATEYAGYYRTLLADEQLALGVDADE
jgi:hypothetical protein